MPKFGKSKPQETFQLFIPYSRKPYLEHKKNVRGENRELFEQLEKIAKQLETAKFHSPVVQEATREFLVILKGTR